MLEIRTRITDILASCQLEEITTGNAGAWDGSGIDLQEMFGDEPQTIAPVSLNELNGIPPLSPLSQDLLPSDVSGTISYELGTQKFYRIVPQHDTCYEGQTLSGPSARHHQQLCLPVVLDGEEKVKCEWSGCSSSVKRDNYTRHVNEIHLRKVKAVCASCGKAFSRSYMKNTHMCRVRHSTLHT
ncbi:hypothetical protein DFH29DRAFT_1004717 [Suillus ampliporus]|nr:hypothetical protein DFH29DRAFT_1004717 [Suillus ampliporus]